MNSSNEISYLETTLIEQRKTFDQLRADIESFKPLPIEAFAEKRQKLFDQVRAYNAEKTDEQLYVFVDEQISAQAEFVWQFHAQFGDQITATTVASVLAIHALCESAINSSLVRGLLSKNKVALFDMLERASLIEKWKISPTAFLESYQFPSGGLMDQYLKQLCKMRNSYTHQKVAVQDANGKLILKGNSVGPMSWSDSALLDLERLFRIPYALQKNLCNSAHDNSLRFRLSCELHHFDQRAISGDDLLREVS